VLLGFLAQNSADNVRDGRGLAGTERFLAPWNATVVELRWNEPEAEGAQAQTPPAEPPVELRSPAPRDLPCAVYLGSHDGIAVMVDPRDDDNDTADDTADDIESTTLRLPVADVTMTTFTPTDEAYPKCTADGVEFVALERD
jgi:hypothetical protein